MSTWLATLPTLLAGEEIDASDIMILVNAMQGITDPMSTYAPTWASTGTAPSLGNGTLTGKYLQSGKLFIARTQLVYGSTTTGGTGTWTFALPVAALDGAQVGVCMLSDLSANATRIAGNAVYSGTTNFVAYAGTGGVITTTTPFSWATGDSLTALIVGEAA
jgi:hypothetical protein